MAKRSALIAASFDYEDSKLRKLRSPATDAEKLARVLRDPSIGDFDVRVLPNLPDHVIRREIGQFFSDRRRDDLLLLHFSCHGVKDEDGNLYFASVDTDVGNLDATAVSAEWVNRQITRSRSRRVVLLLDCCYSGAFAAGMAAKGDDSVHIKERFAGDGRGRVVLTASNAMEYAWEGENLSGSANPSVFTKALVQGLDTGAADLDQDGQVSVDELYDYVYSRVIEATPNQKPGKWSFDVEGDLHIARSRFISDIAALPHELRSAMSNSLPGIREGAVRELGRLLRTGEPDEKIGARAALQNLAVDENSTVATAAASTLEGFDDTADMTIVLPEPTPHGFRDTGGGHARRKRPETIDLTTGGSTSGGTTTGGSSPGGSTAGGATAGGSTTTEPPTTGQPTDDEDTGSSSVIEIDEHPDKPPDRDEPPPEDLPPERDTQKWRPPDWLKPVHMWIAGGVVAVAVIGAIILSGDSPPPPTGSRSAGIIFTRGAGLFVMSSDGGPGRPLPGAPDQVSDPAWSPDGSHIAYIAEDDLFVMESDGSNQRRLTHTDDLEEYHPEWSPDESEIAFGRGDPSGKFGTRRASDIWVIDVNTEQERQITDTPSEENGPTWSPDGERIAFRWGTPANSAIYVVDSGGSEPAEEVVAATAQQLAPSWSPVDSTIVFSRAGMLHRFDIDGDRTVQAILTEDAVPADHRAPAWSPDGSMLVFQGEDADGHVDLYRVNLDGSGLQQLTDTSEAESSPSWFEPQ